MENGKEETSADCLNGDAVDEVNKVPIVDAESKNDAVKASAEISEKIDAEVEVCTIYGFREKIKSFIYRVKKKLRFDFVAKKIKRKKIRHRK